LRLVDSPDLHEVSVKRSAAGHLSWDIEKLVGALPEVLEDVDCLVERNFQSDIFVAPAVIEAETSRRLEYVKKQESAGRVLSGMGKPQTAVASAEHPFN